MVSIPGTMSVPKSSAITAPISPDASSVPNTNDAQYETQLPPEKEKEFWQWLDKQHSEGNIKNGDYNFYKENGYGYGYDFRAAFIKGLKASENGHWSDWGKKPSHSTFSTESIYANEPGVRPGKWKGNTYYPYGETKGISYE
jgi:hypothetical protein